MLLRVKFRRNTVVKKANNASYWKVLNNTINLLLFWQPRFAEVLHTLKNKRAKKQ